MNHRSTNSGLDENARSEQNEIQHLREENSRLKDLLSRYGIKWEQEQVDQAEKPAPSTVSLTTAEKVALFRKLFRGRGDVYHQRWNSAKGKSGYSPACGNE